MNLIEAFLLVFKTLIEVTLKILSPILIVVIFWIIISILYRYKKYGVVEFNVFKKKKEAKFVDIIISMLSKIEGYRKIYKPNNLYADLVVIDKTGVYLLKVIKYHGLVTGNRKDIKLKNQVKLKQSIDIDNPFIHLDQDLNIIGTEVNTKLILITNNIVNVKINGILKEECLK